MRRWILIALAIAVLWFLVPPINAALWWSRGVRCVFCGLN